MCLFSQNIKPFVAEKDIVVYKHLIRVNDGKIYTPHQDTNVEIGKVFKAKGEFPQLPEDYSDNNIGEGVIHAYITKEIFQNEGWKFVKGVIKAGTPFFVQFDMNEIAAAEIVLDDHFITKNEYDDAKRNLDDTHKTIYDILRKENINKDGVSVGDCLLSDKKTFVSPDKLTSDMDIIGIVSFFYKDGRIHITSLKQSEKAWNDNDNNTLDNEVNTYIEAANDFNGQLYTERLAKNHKKNVDDYPALSFCVNYETNGTKNGDWFFGSAGEILQTVRNTYLVNVTVDKLNEVKGSDYAEPINLHTLYWTSAEYSSPDMWGCSTSAASVGYYGKWNARYVRPSLAIG